MEYINFGKVEKVSTSVPVAANDTVYHIIIDFDFVPNCPEIFDSFHTDMGKILECPDDYVLCNVSDIVKVQDELLKLKDRVKELEAKIKAANKQLDKMDADIDELKNKNRDLEKELAESKTFAKVEYKGQSDGSFTITYTKCDGTKEVIGMDSSKAIDATYISCGTVPKCSSCKNHRYYGKISGHMCHLPDSKCIISNTFDIFPLTDEEAEGPACDKFEAK